MNVCAFMAAVSALFTAAMLAPLLPDDEAAGLLVPVLELELEDVLQAASAPAATRLPAPSSIDRLRRRIDALPSFDFGIFHLLGVVSFVSLVLIASAVFLRYSCC
ncbi:MAG: hypothetical protein ACRDP5_24890 [Streptosporangiaceae bacterium]